MIRDLQQMNDAGRDRGRYRIHCRCCDRSGGYSGSAHAPQNDQSIRKSFLTTGDDDRELRRHSAGPGVPLWMLVLTMMFLWAGEQRAAAQDRLGVGIIVGTPTAVSAQIRYPSASSLDMLLAWELDDWFFLQFHYDYRIKTFKDNPDYTIAAYAGPGLFFQSERRHGPLMGLSGNLGLSWTFARHFECFAEISPKIGLIPSTDLWITGGFGFRYVL